MFCLLGAQIFLLFFNLIQNPYCIFYELWQLLVIAFKITNSKAYDGILLSGLRTCKVIEHLQKEM